MKAPAQTHRITLGLQQNHQVNQTLLVDAQPFAITSPLQSPAKPLPQYETDEHLDCPTRCARQAPGSSSLCSFQISHWLHQPLLAGRGTTGGTTIQEKAHQRMVSNVLMIAVTKCTGSEDGLQDTSVFAIYRQPCQAIPTKAEL